MNVLELYQELNARIPQSLSCEWDNDGLMCCPEPERKVRKVLVALDATAAIADRAIREGFDVILTHHPLVFHKLPALDPANPVARKLIRLARAGVAVMSFHTRLDALPGGVNDVLAERLGIRDAVPFGEEGIGRIGLLDEAVTLSSFAERVKNALVVPAVLASDAGVPVHRVAVLGGSGSDDVPLARAEGADTYLSGEIAMHHLTDAPECGMNLIAAGHFHTENPVCEKLAALVRELDGTIVVTVADSNPIRVY